MRTLLTFALTAMLLASVDARGADLDALAKQASAGAAGTEAKVRAVVKWVNGNFEWTATDYKNRTVDEIVERKGGNCNEQAVLVRALLDRLGVKTRRVQEINIQPESAQRQSNAEKQIAKNGFRSSVFGLRHNDHVWIEFKDEASGEWLPADPTLNLVGVDEWIRARVGFDERPTHAILPSRDMLVPIAIFAVEGKTLESRSEHYLIESFNTVYKGSLSTRPSWTAWTSAIRAIDPICHAAFTGTANLHEQTASIESLRQIYSRLRTER